ncbi:alpha/beta family hydrolase [Oryzibacter oryziterrae]|uniref:alpha/beta family hydrolase n=1 Tax=Oryzibacter oryziterrae TaxID=2766474 RepID=UPI001F36B2A1|nr:alpha/beta family hydrolase [Oryzibacter oryziterrae]
MSLDSTIFIYLSGDSYPSDRYIEAALGERFRSAGARFLEQHDVCGQETKFEPRKTALLSTLASLEGGRVVAIGRSSGGRILSLAAAEGAPIEAVIALGYPFRHPKRDEEPERTLHLATTVVPTLILQGANDPYGTKEGAEGRYRLSSAVRIVELPTNHEFRCKPELWDEIARMITEFVEAVERAKSAGGDGSEGASGWGRVKRLVGWVRGLGWRHGA